MPQAPQEVRVAGRGDAKLLGQVLADAFAEDPVFAWLIPSTARNRDQRLRTFFSSMARSYLRNGKTCHLAGDGSAAALWAPPGKWGLPVKEMGIEAVPQGMAFRGSLFRALRTQLHMEQQHPRRPRHWYLGYLGARQECQGKGFGNQLLTTMLAEVDAEGLPAYLESSNEQNLPLYYRHGFDVVGELRLLGRGPTMWRMWRDPAEPFTAAKTHTTSGS